MGDIIHVKDSAMSDKALCLAEGDLTWTSRESAEKIATCAECLREVLRDKCSNCDGTGVLRYCGCGQENCDCTWCDMDKAELMIETRGVSESRPPKEAR